MKTVARTIVTAATAGALLVGGAAPAMARGMGDAPARGNGISAGDVIAGAVVLGGIAAVASTAGGRGGYHDDGRYDSRYGDRDQRDGYGSAYGRGGAGNPRQAVEQCVRYAERDASRVSYGNADVTDIRSVRETRYGYEVRGRIAVNANGRDWRNGDSRYGRGWNGDYRGWNDRLRGYDAGTFQCSVQRGQVMGINYNGIRGL